MIDDKEIMTCREAMEKYDKYYIGFVTTERNYDDPDNEKGYVVCIMDAYDEGFTIPRKTSDGRFISIMSGYAVGGTEIGAILYGGAYHDL
jgi:hypothetical protein